MFEKIHKRILFPAVCFFLAPAAAPAQPVDFLKWEKLPAIPDQQGFAGGYAGVCGMMLVFAGGANFPDKRPWEGGTKTWYDKVFTLEPGASEWREAGRLPKKSGYGLSLQLKDGFVIIGGGDAKENFAGVWKVTRAKNGALKFDDWPALPKPLAMLTGAVVKDYIYVFGGLESASVTEAANVFYRISIKNPAAGWETLPPCPGGGRFLATAGAAGGVFYIFSGARPDGTQAKRVWLTDAWSYDPAGGVWKKLADLPRAAVAAPPQAIPAGKRHLLVVGGDNGAQWEIRHPNHKGFPRTVFAYDTASDAWTTAGEAPFSLVTTSMAPWNGGFVIVSGEREPGIRSPEAWKAAVAKVPGAGVSGK